MEKYRPFLFLFFSFLFFSFCPPAFSQKNPKVIKTLRSDILLPKPLSNKAFKSKFSGVYYVNASMNFGIKKFNIGVLGSHMQCQIFPHYQSEPHAIQTINMAGIRLGYDIFPSKEALAAQTGNFIVVSPFIIGGYNWIDYSRLQTLGRPISGQHRQTYNIFTGINFNLMFSEYDGIGFTLGYNYLHHEFNPYPLRLDDYYSFNEKDTHGPTQYLMFGFNFYVDLRKRENAE